ncbi:MAG: hypothetical protein H0W71_03775 [Sphingomonas sp.]|nr:hypothetical protein [Sphingomonas sp.]
MRLLGRLLTALVLLGVIFLVVSWLWSTVSKALPPGMLSKQDYRLTDPSFVFPLRRDRYVRFPFSQPHDSARLITHADLHPGVYGGAYSLIVEALGSDGQVILRREIFLRSIVLYSRDLRGRIVPRSFYADSTLTPSASDITVLDFQRPVNELRLKAGRLDPGVARIVARVQEQRPISIRQLAVGWQRLSHREQERMAEGNAFPAEMLTDEERRNLLANRWYPVGPAGVQGIHYDRTILYERDIPDGDTLRSQPSAAQGS